MSNEENHTEPELKVQISLFIPKSLKKRIAQYCIDHDTTQGDPGLVRKEEPRALRSANATCFAVRRGDQGRCRLQPVHGDLDH